MAKLPFRVDPEKYLTSNKNQASKMLERICKKYYQDKEVTKMIEAAFEKLSSRGHLVFWEDVSEQEKIILKRAAVSYYIPWDISFSGSISTPARLTFNASKNTPNGTSLNDVLVRGVPNLVKLLHMILGWVCGPEAISGDISQFYNAVLLHPEHLPYQRFLYKKGLDPNAETIEGIIKTLIYGVRSVSSQTETLVRRISEEIEETHPLVAFFLAKCRYVDDLAKGVENKNVAKYIMKTVDQVLQNHHMHVKGWAMSNEKPNKKYHKMV